MSKTGFIQTKLRNHPIGGDVASSALSIEMEKDSSSAESRSLIHADVFRSGPCLVQGQPPDAYAPNIEIFDGGKLALGLLSGLF
jgi:hypothetical protein